MKGVVSIEFRFDADSPSETHRCAGCGEEIWLTEHSLQIQCRLGSKVGGWKETGIWLCDACHDQCVERRPKGAL